MAVIGIDDTDSRTRGMCTTYVARALARALPDEPTVSLVRLCPAVEHKTRGNAALALETDAAPAAALETARTVVAAHAETGDPATEPGVVVAADGAVDEELVAFGRRAVRRVVDLPAALLARPGIDTWHAGGGRGRIGALAAIGASRALADPTVELLAYRERERWGTPRAVDADSVRAAAEAHHPRVWDTVDRAAGEVVAVPRTPGPVLYGIRGEDPAAVRAAADRIDAEPVAGTLLVTTNQGTDAHLQPGTIGAVADGGCYVLEGTVRTAPETRRGGHVHLTLEDGAGATLPCVAFEPTKRFREHVRALVPGDRVTVCGEVGRGTLKLEKFAVRELVETEAVVPSCPDCGRRMESAGRDQGYRCRDCGTAADGRVAASRERSLAVGWYEVPPRARRHVAKPLVRGGFDAPVHPAR